MDCERAKVYPSLMSWVRMVVAGTAMTIGAALAWGTGASVAALGLALFLVGIADEMRQIANNRNEQGENADVEG